MKIIFKLNSNPSLKCFRISLTLDSTSLRRVSPWKLIFHTARSEAQYGASKIRG